MIRFAEVNLLLGPVRDEGRQHRDLVEQRLDVAEDDPGLLAVRGQDHHDAPLAGGQDVAVGLEAREEHRDERGDPRSCRLGGRPRARLLARPSWAASCGR